MKKSRFIEDQIVGTLKEQEAGLAVASSAINRLTRSRLAVGCCCIRGCGFRSLHPMWFEVSEARKLKALEDENAKLKRMVAKAMLDNVALKDLLGKKVVAPAARREAVACLRSAHERASGGRSG